MSDEANKELISMEEVEEIPISLDVNKERQKPRLLSILFCDFFNTTNDKKANLLGVFDRVYVHPESKLTPRFVVYVRTAETKGRIDTRVIAPDGKAVAQFVSIPDDNQTYLPNLPINMQVTLYVQFGAQLEGIYWFDVSYQGESLGGAGLVVEYRDKGSQKRGTDTYP